MPRLRENEVETVFADLDFVQALKPRDKKPSTRSTTFALQVEQVTDYFKR